MDSSMQEKGPTRIFGEYIAAAKYEDIPDPLRKR